MKLELKNKVALITGGNRGIGAGIAHELAQEGVHICLVARNKDLLDQTAVSLETTFGVRARAIAVDLRELASAQQAVDFAMAEFGRLDLLVNNAGATMRGDFFSLSEDNWDDGYSLKFRACVRMTRTAWPHLKQQGGAVVNISGVGGWVADAEFTIGGTVNSALHHFTKAMAQIGQRDGVRVNAINPGRIETERLTRNIERLAQLKNISIEESRANLLRDCHIERFGRPHEIGQVAAFLLSPRASFMQGALIDVDGGQTRAL